MSGETLSAALSRRCLHDTDPVPRLCELRDRISPWAGACMLCRDLGKIDLNLLESIREIIGYVSPDSSLSIEAEQYVLNTVFGIICELGRLFAIVSESMSLMTAAPPIGSYSARRGMKGDSKDYTQTRSEFVLAGCITEKMASTLIRFLLPGELG